MSLSRALLMLVLASLPAQAKVSAANRTLIRMAGDKSALVLVVRPDRWGRADGPDLWAAFRAIAHAQFVSLPASLPGLDTSRAMVLGAGETDDLPPSRISDFIFEQGGKLREPVTRYRAIVPASDRALLKSSMESLLDTMGFRRDAGSPAEGSVTFYTRGYWGIAVIPERDSIRVEVIEECSLPSLLPSWRAIATSPPGIEPSVDTPALTYAAAADDAAAVSYMRPWRIASAATAAELCHALAGFHGLDPDPLTLWLIRTHAWSYPMDVYRYLALEPGDVDDVATVFRGGARPRVEGMLTLSRGAATLFRSVVREIAAARTDAGGTIDWRALLGRFRAPGAVPRVEDRPKDCRAACDWYLLAHYPLRMAARAVAGSAFKLDTWRAAPSPPWIVEIPWKPTDAGFSELFRSVQAFIRLPESGKSRVAFLDPAILIQVGSEEDIALPPPRAPVNVPDFTDSDSPEWRCYASALDTLRGRFANVMGDDPPSTLKRFDQALVEFKERVACAARAPKLKKEIEALSRALARHRRQLMIAIGNP
jgi:hypothetical protein